MALWTDVLAPGAPVLEKVLRPIIVYAFLIVGLRLAGRRELGQLNTFDLVVVLTISNTVQNAIIGNDNSVLGGLIGAATLLALNYGVNRYLNKHAKLEEAWEGEPVDLVRNGRVLWRNLREQMVTRAELEAAVRQQGVATIDQVALAVLETNGTVSVIAKDAVLSKDAGPDVNAQLDEIRSLLAKLVENAERPAPSPPAKTA